VVKTRGGAGKLSAKLVVDLASYAGESVSLLLHDTDTPAIAARLVGPVPPKGKRGNKWSYTAKAPGLTRVALADLDPTRPGQLRVKVKAAHWFAAAAANQPASATTFAIRIGGQCFAHAVTTKTD
jgi:hypothetical protein